MKKIARMCRRLRELILNWFQAKGKISNGVVEGMSDKSKLTIKKILWFLVTRRSWKWLYYTPWVNYRKRN